MEIVNQSRIPEFLKRYETEILADWLREQMSAMARHSRLLTESELMEQSAKFLKLFQEASQKAQIADPNVPEWNEVKEMLKTISQSRSKLGFSPSETASFIFSLKQPIFNKMRQEMVGSTLALVDDLWSISFLLDQLGLYTTEVYQKAREEIILRQQQEMLELSTPVVKLAEGILAIPMIGTLDSNRTQVVMETLLQRILDTGSDIAIIDITGVPTVDTLVAQHLIKTVTAAKLMGAECIISGIRPQIASTIVHLGVGLGDIETKSSLADAFSLALTKTGRMLCEIQSDFN